MLYKLKDALQASLGALVALLLFFMLEANNLFNIKPLVGLVVGLLWVLIVSYPLWDKSKKSKVHIVCNFIITLFISTVLSLVFETTTIDILKGFTFFGSSAWMGLMLGLPLSNFFERRNILSIYKRYYLNGRR